MPVLHDSKRGNFVKVLRPNGSKFARGEYNYEAGDRTSMGFWADVAISRAFGLFEEEFGHKPLRDRTVIEVTFTKFRASATVYELRSPGD